MATETKRDGTETLGEQKERAADRSRRHIGAEIRWLRQQRGWSIDELASASGVSASHLKRLEGGLAAPQPLMVASLGRALGVLPTHFADFEREVARIDLRLVDYLREGGCAGEQIEELLRLSPPARQALWQAFDALRRA